MHCKVHSVDVFVFLNCTVEYAELRCCVVLEQGQIYVGSQHRIVGYWLGRCREWNITVYDCLFSVGTHLET